ncbi:hypothetical protein G7Z17_g11666 [Cylindrodendrum hubeiense]|uniref:Uncharacterized protein n=1 Tax=Cylindrodendrum hubeiense TaxID=595255 RepID=A0A9P5H3H6_9HYPO|nr:hypothetical protein G7Z17_g11666 [Cylindrodendrum hubeiense]
MRAACRSRAVVSERATCKSQPTPEAGASPGAHLATFAIGIMEKQLLRTRPPLVRIRAQVNKAHPQRQRLSMSRRGKSGAHSEYSIRWHSYADITTPSVDIMSSPDPLNDSAAEALIVPSSAHRVTRSVTRSIRSDRFLPRDTSPRKQTFELEVGDNRAPQKLLVTVETEGAPVNAPDGGARRKLFQSSSPMPMMRQRERATTTTIPLKDTIEEEPMDINATPRRRGRPRKSNGTPLPGAGVKRRAGTPIKRTPQVQPTPKSARRGRPPKNRTAEPDDGLPQPKLEPTPKSARRGRPPKNRTVEPSSELGIELGRGVTSTTKARRRQALAPEELIEVVNEALEPALDEIHEAQEEDNEVTLVIAPSETGASEAPIEVAEPASEADSDIWMATLDDEPTPRAVNRTAQTLPASSSPEPEADMSQAGDYGYLAPAASDISSADDPPGESRPMGNDTIAQGEDFSMIFMDSLPSIQELRSSVRAPAEDEYGEETSLIINNTLESLRESLRQREEPNTNTETAETPEHPSLVFIEPASAELHQPSIRPPMSFSPNRNMSPRWLRSPRRGSVSPLRHQVLKFKAMQTDDNVSNIAEGNVEGSDVPSPEQRTSPGQFNQEESNMYDDSFSEIPQDVLEAATPRRPRVAARDDELMDEVPIELVRTEEEPVEEELVEEQFVEEQPVEEQPAEEEPVVEEPVAEEPVVEEPMDEERMDEEFMDEELMDEALVQDEPIQEDQEMEDEQPHQQIEGQYAPETASNVSVVSRSDAGRLPTPDDTPPQIEAEADDQGKSTQTSQASVGVVSPKNSSPLAMSARRYQVVPEIVEEMVDDLEEELQEVSVPETSKLSLDSHLRRPEVTPVNQLTSPLQDPQSLAPETALEKISRPLLSPIVRAGRALQSVTSDPPSPEPREHQLRSPFRSSVPRELGPPAQDLQPNRRISLSPRRPFSFPAGNQVPPAGQLYDDPFVTDRRQSGQISFMEALERSSGNLALQRTHELPRSRASSMRITPPNDEVMSWVADEGPISASLRGDVPLKDFARSTNAEVAMGLTSHEEPDDAVDDADDVDDVDDTPQERDDDTDIWEFEAKRTSPRTTRQQPFGNKRRTLPNTWMRQSTQRPQLDDLIISEGEEEAPAGGVASDVDRTEKVHAEEYSLLAPGQGAKEPEQPAESAKKASRFDLASFFSSPAAIPGMLAEKFLPAKTTSVFGTRAGEPESVQAELVQVQPVLATSSMFPQVAQKEFQPRNSSRIDLFSPSRDKEQEPMEETQASSTQEAPEASEMPSIAQKQNFTPRPQPKQPNASFFKSSTRSSATTPPRMQLSHADIQRWQHQTSVASEGSPEVSRPLLRPLPPKHASPSKSSLRSPMKPHTPGRVVEFTSSVLSPVEQAKARQSRRLSNSSATQPSIASQRPPPPSQTVDKENHAASDISMSEASPLAKAPQPAPLSRTVWTRQHWLLLDELLQLRRAGPYELNYERRADKFLGKTVKSQGEAMRLERWHLDCVDAFKASVGGWDEAVLAKRLFALILGEERRSRGDSERPARVMFH